MRNAISLLLGCLVAGAGCKEDQARTKPPAAPAPAPQTVEQTPTRGPTTDRKDIQGKWETAPDKEPVQAEFADDTIILRAGPGPDWKETARAKFKLNDQLLPSQIDWGEGPTAARGLYTIDGKNLIITYATGGPEVRPKRLDARIGPNKQLFMSRVE